MRFPATIHGSFQGTAAAFQDSLSSEPLLILAALVAVYIVLGMLYESYIHPITILSTIPSAGTGALLALMLFHMELNVIWLVGILLLIGIVKKNAIMMIDFALEMERQGKTPLEAIHEAALLRFRPIMMTTAAALLGAVPLAFGRGTGSELRRPLGVAIVGGLMVSQMLTHLHHACGLLYLDRFQTWFLSRTCRGEEAVAEEGSADLRGLSFRQRCSRPFGDIHHRGTETQSFISSKLLRDLSVSVVLISPVGRPTLDCRQIQMQLHELLIRFSFRHRWKSRQFPDDPPLPEDPAVSRCGGIPPRAHRVALLVGVVALDRIKIGIVGRPPAEQYPRLEVSIFFAVSGDPSLSRHLVCTRFRQLVRVHGGEVPDLAATALA